MNKLPILLLLSVFYLAGCVAAPPATPTATKDIASISPTAAALSATSTLLPTFTPTPTATQTPALPSATKTSTATPTLVPAQAAICEDVLEREAVTSETPADFQIAYVSQEALWLWNSLVGEAVIISDTLRASPRSLSQSTDGKWIALWLQNQEYHNELWLFQSDGLGAKRAVAKEFFPKYTAQVGDPYVIHLLENVGWIPGIDRYLFSVKWFQGDWSIPYYDDLWVVDANTLTIRQVFGEGEGGKFVFSPDGNLIALVKPQSISILKADFTFRWQNALAYEDPQIFFGEYEFYPSPVWSSDSQSLYVAIPSKDIQSVTGTLTTWQISAESGIASQIGVITANDPFPSLAADQKLIAFSLAGQLHASRFNGMDVFPISWKGTHVYWSPGARYFTVVTVSSSIDRHFSVYDLCGRETIRIIGAHNWHGWLDDSRFIYTGYVPGTLTSGLFLGSIDGSITEIASGLTVDAIDVAILDD